MEQTKIVYTVTVLTLNKVLRDIQYFFFIVVKYCGMAQQKIRLRHMKYVKS